MNLFILACILSIPADNETIVVKGNEETLIYHFSFESGEPFNTFCKTQEVVVNFKNQTSAYLCDGDHNFESATVYSDTSLENVHVVSLPKEQLL